MHVHFVKSCLHCQTVELNCILLIEKKVKQDVNYDSMYFRSAIKRRIYSYQVF